MSKVRTGLQGAGRGTNEAENKAGWLESEQAGASKTTSVGGHVHFKLISLVGTKRTIGDVRLESAFKRLERKLDFGDVRVVDVTADGVNATASAFLHDQDPSLTYEAWHKSSAIGCEAAIDNATKRGVPTAQRGVSPHRRT
jgi:hypothetical protein